ncbi:MAG: glycosyltransferase, partial [Sphingobium sp.]
MTRPSSRIPETVMIWNAARGGMRSVVEGYRDDGFLDAHRTRLIAAYGDGGFARRQFILILALARFLFVLTTRPVGLVHVHAAMRGSFWRKGLFSSLARLFGKPVILHLHGSEMKSFYAALPIWAQRMVCRHLEKATCVVALSESWREFIEGIAPRARVAVIPNYIRLSAPTGNAGRNPRSILFLGLIGDRKGVFDLLPAFSAVHRNHPDARLCIGGNGEVERARASARSMGIGNV